MTASGEPTILARTARGANWMIAWRLANRVLGLLSMLIVLRLLSPDDFGLMTLAFAFSLALEAFTALGVEAQIVRSRNADRDLYDTAFTFNILRASLLAGLVAAGSGAVAAWFADDRLQPILFVFAGNVLLNGITSIRTAGFQRELEFGKIFLLRLVPRLVQVACTVSVAVAFRNYWALVLGIVAGSLVTVGISYALAPYRPRLTLVAWRELFDVSVWTWLINVISILRDRTEMFVIGRSFGTIQAGLFSVAQEFASLPVTELVSPISHAAMPGFAAEIRQGGLGQTAIAFLRVAALAILLAVPIGTGTSLVSGPFVSLAIGQRWAEAAPLMALIAIMMVPIAPGLIAGALLTARAKLRTLCAITAVASLLRGGLVMAVTPHWGLRGIAFGMGLSLLVENALLLRAASRDAAVPLSRLLAASWRPLAAAVAMVAALKGAGLAWLPPPPAALEAAAALLGASALGAAAFAAVLAGLWLLAGQPQGAETDALLMGRRSLSGIAAKLGRRGG